MYNAYTRINDSECKTWKQNTNNNNKKKASHQNAHGKNEQCTWVERGINKISPHSMNYHFEWINNVAIRALKNTLWAVFQ